MGAISNIFLSIKENIVENTGNLNYESKLYNDSLEKSVSIISEKTASGYMIDNYEFKDASTLVATLRNKIAHGDFLIDFDKEEVMHRTLKIEISAKKDHDKIIDYIADKFYFDHHGTANSFEICDLDTSKATGVEKVLEHLNIDKDHSYAFGDGLNDLEMIKYVGHGIAMKNAVDQLKEVADEVIGHVDENGLEEYLKRIY